MPVHPAAASPFSLLACNDITLMLSCAGSITVDRFRRSGRGSLRLRKHSAHMSLAVVAAEDGHVGPGVAFAVGLRGLAFDRMAESPQ